MPWKRAKALGPPLLGLELFAQAFRIQREAIAAAGHFIPMVQENVRGANPWVREEFGRSRWAWGSFHLWGDVPALMPIPLKRHAKVKTMGAGWYPPGRPKHVPGLGFNTHAERQMKAEDTRGVELFEEMERAHIDRATKNSGGSWFNVAHNTESGTGQNPDGRLDPGTKIGGGWFRDSTEHSLRRHSSKSSARKAASARIARIPLALSRHIARVYFPC